MGRCLKKTAHRLSKIRPICFRNPEGNRLAIRARLAQSGYCFDKKSPQINLVLTIARRPKLRVAVKKLSLASGPGCWQT